MEKTPYPLNGLVAAFMEGAAPALAHLAACGWWQKQACFDVDFLRGTGQEIGKVANEPGAWNALGFLQARFIDQLKTVGMVPDDLLAARGHFGVTWPGMAYEGCLRAAPKSLPGECHLALVMADGATRRGCAQQDLAMPADLPRNPGPPPLIVAKIRIEFTWPGKEAVPTPPPPPPNPALAHAPPRLLVAHPVAGNAVPVTVFFLDCSAGWIHLVVNDGTSHHTVRLSEVYDPFANFIVWLEAVAAGAVDPVWVVDEEGHEETLRFTADPADARFGTLALTGSYRPESIHLQARVSRRQLMDAFYQGFRDFVDSPLYRPAEWEEASYGRAFQAICGGRYSPEEIAQFVSERDASLLEKLFADEYCLWYLAFDDSERGVQRKRAFVAALTGQVPDYEPGSERKSDDRVFFDAKYQALSPAGQRAWKLDLLAGCCSSWSGMALGDLRSAPVERWLALS